MHPRQTDFKRVARCRELPLDLVPAIYDGSLSITALFQGKPVANQRISIWPPQGKSFSKKTDAKRRFSKLDKLVAGQYSFATYHTLKDASGKFEGKPYKGMMHGSSCTIRWPLR